MVERPGELLGFSVVPMAIGCGLCCGLVRCGEQVSVGGNLPHAPTSHTPSGLEGTSLACCLMQFWSLSSGIFEAGAALLGLGDSFL